LQLLLLVNVCQDAGDDADLVIEVKNVYLRVRFSKRECVRTVQQYKLDLTTQRHICINL